ncbi:MAG: spore cortex biosynthesis protein YabQ [Lachnospiraceae bacterium]|nr:spore cortex biosynthesis protein YabQ [Lachnospiraceae bacterium]
MLSSDLLREWELCLIGVLSGMEMMAVYDLLRIWRNLRRPHILRVNVEDVLFGVFCGLWMFLRFLHSNDGRIRWYVLFSLVLGMLLWRRSLSPLIVGGLTAVLRTLGRGLSFAGTILVKIVKFCGKPLKKGVKWFRIIFAVGFRTRDHGGTASNRQGGRSRGSEASQ